MDLSSEKLLRASEFLPFPIGRSLEVNEELESEEAYNLVKAIFNITEDGKIKDINAYKTHLREMSELILYVNELGAIPNNIAYPELVALINKHNTYINKPYVNLSYALMNYTTSMMFNIGKDPCNLRLGMSSVDASDGAANTIKDESKGLPYERRMGTMDPGSLTSYYRMLTLCNGGKKNTGIVASSLKVFEAYYQYCSNVLNHGSEAEQQSLLINRTICGKNVRLIANAYQQLHSKLPEPVAEALEQIDQAIDAFLLYSGFLSLSTDNAKDPTLVKINAGETMLGLYLAGLSLGMDTKVLIKVLTSDFALNLATKVPSNLYTNYEGFFDIKSILRYVKYGPKDIKIYVSPDSKAYKNLPDWIKSKDLPGQLSVKDCYYVLKATRKLSSDDLDGVGGYIESKPVTALNGKDLQLILVLLENANKGEFKRYNQKLLELKAWDRLASDGRFSKVYLSEKDTEGLNVQNELILLCLMLDEMKLFSLVAKLNQSLPNTIGELIAWVRKFELKINKRLSNIKTFGTAEEYKDAKKILDAEGGLAKKNEEILRAEGIEDQDLINALKYEVDLLHFIKDKSYRDIVIKTYDSIKYAVNIFRVMTEVEHYMGYLETLAALIELNRSLSMTWNLTDFLSKHYLKQYLRDPESSEKVYGRISDLINMSIILDFLYNYYQGREVKNSLLLPSYVLEYTGNLKLQDDKTPNIVLGTITGNATFKYIFEHHVITRLKTEKPSNLLISDLDFIKTDKTINGETIVKLATRTKLIPSNTFEELRLALYKEALADIQSIELKEFGNMQFIDALFLYNLIVNQNNVRENALTSLFEELIYNQGAQAFQTLSDLISKFFDFLKPTEDYIKAKIKEFDDQNTVIDFLQELAPIDPNFQTGLPFIKKINPVTGKPVLLLKVRKTKSSSTDDEYDENYDSGMDEAVEFDPELEFIMQLILDDNDSDKIAQAEEDAQNYFIKQVKRAGYNVITTKPLNILASNLYTIKDVKSQIIPLEWEKIKDRPYVKSLEVHSLEELYEKLGVQSLSLPFKELLELIDTAENCNG